MQFPTLQKILSYTKPYKSSFIFTIVMSIVLAGLAPVRPYLIQLSVDEYIANNLWEGLMWICLLHFGVLVVESFLRFWFMYTINWLGQTVVNDLRKNIFKKIIFQNVGFYDKTAIGTLTTRTINDVEAINEVFSQGLISIIADVLTIIAIMGVMFYSDWQLTLICLTPFPILIIATYFFKESVRKSFQRVRNAVSHLNAFVQEHISGMYLIQAFAAEKREAGKFNTINKEHKNANIKAIFAYSVFFPVVEIILAISLGLLVWWGAIRILNYEVTAGIIISFILYLNLLFRPLRMLADKFNVLQMGLIAGDRVFTILESNEHLKQNGNIHKEKISGEVVFENVDFSYKKDIPVLRNLSFTVPAGKTLAIVGHTGAGKTSIISIINRLYEIQAGKISIDGVNIKDYDIKNLRKHIGIVLQDVFLFSGTIMENITLRDENIAKEEVIKITQAIGIHDFIMSLPGDYDFNVMERGNTLSQGQKQLLSFARALLYNPSILILDEATSSIDTASELLIQKAIDTLTENRTAIVIAHRLSTIRKADNIIVLDKGTIIEQGNHNQLIKTEGAYYQLYKAVESSTEKS